MAQVEAADFGRKNLAEQALSVLADVRAGEGAGVLLVSYSLLKTIGEPLILIQGGALPHSLGEQLTARMQGPPPARGTTPSEEALANLLESSPSIAARLEEMAFDAGEL
jgi:hypothetical protein